MKGFLLLLLVAFATAKVSYDGHQVFRIQYGVERELLNKVVNGMNLDVWSHSGKTMDVRASPDQAKLLRIALTRYRFKFETMIPDLGVLIREEEERLSNKPKAVTFDDYNTFEEIEAYLQSVALDHADIASLSSLGKSVEGRDLWQLKISTGAGHEPLWLDWNIHAREWITSATCLWGINNIVTNYQTDADIINLLNRYDLYILPINNPDGYAFTWSDDRMWRKNRNKYDTDTCYGVDINRNFDDHFGGEGTSPNSCTETYHGPSAASEPETVATQNGIKAIAGLRVLFSIHSYSQLWMYPYGWTDAASPDDAELDRVAKVGVEALTAVHGTPYVYGPVSTTIYPAASTTIDYSYAQGVTYSYTIELRDTGANGFILPKEQIVPTAEETWAGIYAAVDAVPPP